MKLNRIASRVLLFTILIFAGLASKSQNSTDQSNTKWTQAKADQWFAGKKWLNGLKIQPHESINHVEFAKQYHNHKAWWDKAFAFLKTHNLDSLKPGEYPIDGKNVYAVVTELAPTPFEKSKWHSHRKYNDLQYIIRGKDKIGVAEVADLVVKVPYKEDSQSYDPDSKGTYYIADQQSFFILTPTEAHRPFIKIDGYDLTKRIIIKVSTVK